MWYDKVQQEETDGWMGGGLGVGGWYNKSYRSRVTYMDFLRRFFFALCLPDYFYAPSWGSREGLKASVVGALLR